MDSSKRSLYKPAPVENTTVKETRRPLVQGRLTNDTVLPESLTLYASPSVDTAAQDTVTRISHSASGISESSMTSVRQSMASLNLSHRTASLSSDISTSLPRSSPSHHYSLDRVYSPPRSPSKPSPSDFLELSDSDREYRHTPPVRHVSASPGSPVLLVDASGYSLGQGQSEVEVRMANISSPAKVVCHTLSSFDNDLRNTGYTEEAARVHIDSVPSVTLLDDVNLGKGTSADSSNHPPNGLPGPTHDSPAVSRDSSGASHISGDTDSTTSTLKPNEMPSHQDSQDALHEFSAESERPSTAMSMDEQRGSESTKKRRKAKAKFVQSRYMQSVAKPAASAPNISANAPKLNFSGTKSNITPRTKKSASVAGTRSSASGTGTRTDVTGSRSYTSGTRTRPASVSVTGGKSERSGALATGRLKTGRIKTDHSKTTREKPVPMRATKSFAPASTTTTAAAAPPSHHKQPPSTNRDSQFNTPVAPKKKMFISTPTVNTSMLPGASHMNASAIGPSTSILGANMSAIAHADSSKLMPDRMGDSHDKRDQSKRERGMSGDMTGQYSGLSGSPTHDSAYSSLGHKQAKPLTQSDLDVLYGRYIQWVYLDKKMEKMIAEKEKEAMSQFYGMWQMIDELSRKKSQMDLKLARLRHANMLDHQLDIQETGLGPVTAHLSQFKQQYSTLAHALDTTRHQVEMTDILLPQDKDVFHESLERALSESEHLLGEISMATRNKQPKVESFSTAISMLESAVCNESEELRRCQELLAATSSLTTHETSLRVQDLEQRSAE